MVKHIVMWNIQENLDKEEVKRTLKAKLEALIHDIDYLLKIELGFNYNDNETGRELVLYTEFETKEDLENYLVHPAHKEVGKYVRAVVCNRVDVDCEL